jgi:hypothetical protein
VFLATFFGFATLLASTSSQAVAVTVEIGSDVDTLVDAPLARRLIRLELADVELPKVNDGAGQRSSRQSPSGMPRAADEVVFVRLLRQGDGLVVELWARGELSGERRLAVSSNEQHQARRVALASAELARRLREVRMVERQRLLRQHLAPNPETTPLYLTKVNVEGFAGVGAAMWFDANAVLVGPRLYLGVVTESGVGMGFTGGAFTSTAPSVVRSWTELGLRPNWQLALGRHFELALGLDLAAGVVEIAPTATFPGSEVSHQTWQAKLGLDVQLQWLVSPRVNLVLAPEAALFARQLRIERQETSDTLDGGWLGVSLGALVYL